MSESIYDLAREAEHLKSSLQHLQESSAPIDTALVWSTRQRLEDSYRQMLLLDLGTALKTRVEVDLWNSVFRNQITALQTSITHLQSIQRDEMLATYDLFLENTCGFYYQLLQNICYKYNSPFPAFLTPEEIGVCRRPTVSATAGEASVREIGQECLMRMGDASRYKGEYSLAKKYYLQANELSPGRGILSNQLGLIASSQGNFYKAAFHYSHSVVSRSPFSLSRNNLEQIFETHVRQFPDEISNIPSFQIGLLYLISLLYFPRDLSFFTLLLPKLTAVLSSILQQGDDNYEFMLCTVGLCLFACVISYQPLAGITLDQARERLTTEELQKCRFSLLLLFETTQVLVSSTIPKTRPMLITVLPFITATLHWLSLHIHHTPVEELTQLPSLWHGTVKLFNSLSLKVGFEASIDLTQSMSEEISLIEFLSHEYKHNTTNSCSKDSLCMAKFISRIKCIVRHQHCDFLSLNTHGGFYQLIYTSPVAAAATDDVITSPTLSPLFASPMLNNSSDCSFFPSIWSDSLYQQPSPLLATPTTSVDTIQSLWNASDPASP